MKKMKRHFQFKLKSGSTLNVFNDGNLMDVCQKQLLKQQAELLDLRSHLRLFIKDMIRSTDTVENMYSCFRGIYEPHWVGNLEFNFSCQDSIKIWRQYIADFKCNISKNIDNYNDEFLDMKKSIDRRNKKLSELNRYQASYNNQKNAKKSDPVKLQKTLLELTNAEDEYKTLNKSLKEVLPKFCDKRIGVYVHFWTKLNEAEEAMFKFLQENRKSQMKALKKLGSMIESDEYSILSQVNAMNTSGTNLLSTKDYTASIMPVMSPSRQLSRSSSFVYDSYGHIANFTSLSPIDSDANTNRMTSFNVTDVIRADDTTYTKFYSSPKSKLNIESQISSGPSSNIAIMSNKNSKHHKDEASRRRTPPMVSTSDFSDVDDEDTDQDNPYAVIKKKDTSLLQVVRNSYETKDTEIGDVYSTVQDHTALSNESRNSNGTENCYGKDIGHVYSTVEDDRYYYQVLVTHDFLATCNDELTLKKKDLIMILPENSDKQRDDGWLYGENFVTKEKGLFPENHTKIFN